MKTIDRFDANCTPGKTVKCGNVCRTPINCKKGKPGSERVKTIGREQLAQYAQEQKAKRQPKPIAKPPVKGGAIVPLAGKIEAKTEQKSPKKGRKKLTGQAAIDEKWASAKPTQNDVEGWLKDTATAAVKPTKSNIHRSILKDLAITHGINEVDDAKEYKAFIKLKGQDDYAKFMQQREKSKSGGKQYDWKTFSGWGGEDEKNLETAKKRTKSGKTEASRAKAQKEVDRLEKRKADDRATAEAAAKRENAKNSASPDDRINAYKQRYSQEFTQKATDLKKLSDRVAKGDMKAVREAAAPVVYGLDTFSPTTGKAFAANSKNLIDTAVSEHLQNTANQGKVAERSFGLEKGFSAEELKQAYRKAARKAHPDQGGSEEEFRKVNQAYEGLKKKYNFDSFLTDCYLDNTGYIRLSR